VKFKSKFKVESYNFLGKFKFLKNFKIKLSMRSIQLFFLTQHVLKKQSIFTAKEERKKCQSIFRPGGTLI
jgi:hypothetical protein